MSKSHTSFLGPAGNGKEIRSYQPPFPINPAVPHDAFDSLWLSILLSKTYANGKVLGDPKQFMGVMGEMKWVVEAADEPPLSVRNSQQAGRILARYPLYGSGRKACGGHLLKVPHRTE